MTSIASTVLLIHRLQNREANTHIHTHTHKKKLQLKIKHGTPQNSYLYFVPNLLSSKNINKFFEFHI